MFVVFGNLAWAEYNKKIVQQQWRQL